MNEQQLAELKRIKAILSAVTGLEDDDQEYIEDARKALQSIISQDALGKMAKNAREIGLDYEPAPVQEAVAWEVGPHLVMRTDMRERLAYKGPWVDMGRAIPDGWVPVLYTTPPAAQPAPVTERYRVIGPTGDEYWTNDKPMSNCKILEVQPLCPCTPPAQPAPVQEPVQPVESWEDLHNALQRIDTAAVGLPTFEVRHEGGLDAVVQNIVDAIVALYEDRTTPPAAQPAPVQEPVAVVSGYHGGQCVVTPTNPARLFSTGTAFYTTAAQPAVQEPVAQALSRDAVLANMAGWLRHLADDVTIPYFTNGSFKADCNEAADVLLEITPPAAQKPWVDLTDEEIMAAPENLVACIAYVRNKLREKNGADQQGEQGEQGEQVEQVVEPTPQERRAAGQWHCPECYTFGHQHRSSCSHAKKGNTP